MTGKRWAAKDELRAIFQANPKQWFYINELIRLTGRYPNAIQQALKGLERAGEVRVKRLGNKRFFQIIQTVKPSLSLGRPTSNRVNWVKLVNRKTSLDFNCSVAWSNMHTVDDLYGINLPTLWYNGLTGGAYYNQNELMALGRKIGERLDRDLSFAKKDINRCRVVIENLIQYGQTELTRRFKGLSLAELNRLLAGFYQVYLPVFPYMTTPHGIERYFERKIRTIVQDEEVVAALMAPVFVRDPVVERGLQVACILKGKTDQETISLVIKAYWSDYCWLSMFSLDDQPLKQAYFEMEVAGLLKRVADPRQELVNLRKREEGLKLALENKLKVLGAKRQLSQMVWLLQEYIRLRTERKNALCQAHYLVRPLLVAISQTLSWTYSQVCLLNFKELEELLGDIKQKSKWQQVVEKRSQGWAILMWRGQMKIITGAVAIVQAMERFRIVQKRGEEGGVIKGRPASLGVAEGPVKVVRAVKDLSKVAEGDVLVARMTTPDYVPAMRRAVAIVTDEGGVTCHAAIVARELGLPCVIATQRATQVLSDGVLVRVDGQAGEVSLVKLMARQSLGPWVGTAVYPGKVTTRVRLIEGVKDFDRVRNGEIVVCAQTSPEYLSVLYRAGGLVVDEDSVSGHGVVYARALKLPCIMGTGNAREGLRDGQKVTLDAGNGVVRVV
ncbi:hypothetical protein A2W24_06635 [Microgenomates group bacterium RBG_16_45_19]|nr:MAG: hypothetical protein A2W24_06635 [Microgenomates group bacterium RBG_16_45_19]